MLTLNNYQELITKPSVTNEELTEIIAFEDFIYNAIIYQEDINKPEINKIITNYQTLLQNLKLLPKERLNSNITNAITRGENLFNRSEEILHKDEKEFTLQRKLKQGIDTRAGFTNAFIIIFLVLLVGLISSVIILSLKN